MVRVRRDQMQMIGVRMSLEEDHDLIIVKRGLRNFLAKFFFFFFFMSFAFALVFFSIPGAPSATTRLNECFALLLITFLV
jgi:hypothetical protein